MEQVYRPMPEYVWVEVLSSAQKNEDGLFQTEGGLLVTDDAERMMRTNEAAVRSVGSLVPKECDLETGDIVVYSKWGGHCIREGGKEYRLLKWDDIYAVKEST